jgi:site-specific DNA-cytosine methylase
MKILQLCFITNLWPDEYQVESWDIKNGKDVLQMPEYYGKDFDMIVAAPPCDQFTKANSLNWQQYPTNFIMIAQKCLDVCEKSGKTFVLENPPGRIEKFCPGLTKYRILTWRGRETNKEYVLYSNQIILLNPVRRYGKQNICRSKSIREEWQPDLVETILQSL